MNLAIADLLYRLLDTLKCPVPFQEIYEKVNSHPHHPSLLCITDTLDLLGIDYQALVVQKENWPELPAPFIIHTTGQGGDFILVNKNNFFKQHPQVYNEWNGIVLVPEKPSKLSAELRRLTAKKNKQRYGIIAAAFLFILASLLPLFIDLSLTSLQPLVALLGVFIGMLIFQHESGFPNALTDQFCSIGKQTDCNAVLKSKGGRLPFALRWSDVGLIYFAATWLIYMAGFLSQSIATIQPLLGCVAVITAPFTIISLYYQWRVVKKWCTLCLATVGLLWVQCFIAGRFALQALIMDLSWRTGGFIIGIVVLMAICWLLLIKPIAKQNKQLGERLISLLKWKRDPQVISALLKPQRQVNTTVFEKEWQLGDPDAPLQLLVACSLYCKPCSNAHNILHELLEKNLHFGLTIRFLVSNDVTDERSKAAAHLFQLLLNRGWSHEQDSIADCRQLLHDWYQLNDLNQFAIQYPLMQTMPVEQLLKEHQHWITENNIQHTPTIFINGYELPKAYSVDDLPLMISSLAEIATEMPVHTTKEDYIH
jgi:hypothetical protein